jgi:hypothetical protein
MLTRPDNLSSRNRLAGPANQRANTTAHPVSHTIHCEVGISLARLVEGYKYLAARVFD